MTNAKDGAVPSVAIVDDEEDITTYLRIALEDAGYRVVTINAAAGAVALLENEKPDLICLDLLMPEQTGASIYAELKGHPRLGSVPILILSGLADREELPSLLHEAGSLPEPADFIEKPVDIRAFLGVVERVLGRQTGTLT
jgi:DNA-binding response OmpR family regulator